MKSDLGEYSEFSIFGYDFEYTQFYQDWIAGHFEIGVRYTDYNFTRLYASGPDDQYFIGSIDSIQAEDPGFGLRNLNLSWFPWANTAEEVAHQARPLFLALQCIGVEFGWDSLRAKTITSARSDRPAYSDGTIYARGPMLSYVVRVENPTRITPYFGFGSIFYNDVGSTKGWWHLGFPNENAYKEWRAGGSPDNPNSGWRRTFKVQTENGLSWYAGATVEIHASWKLDLFYRHTSVVLDNSYEISLRGKIVETQKSKWDLSNETYGLGLRYTF